MSELLKAEELIKVASKLVAGLPRTVADLIEENYDKDGEFDEFELCLMLAKVLGEKSDAWIEGGFGNRLTAQWEFRDYIIGAVAWLDVEVDETEEEIEIQFEIEETGNNKREKFKKTYRANDKLESIIKELDKKVAPMIKTYEKELKDYEEAAGIDPKERTESMKKKFEELNKKYSSKEIVRTTVDKLMKWYVDGGNWSRKGDVVTVAMTVNGKHAQDDGQSGESHIEDLLKNKNKSISVAVEEGANNDYELSFKIGSDRYEMDASGFPEV